MIYGIIVGLSLIVGAITKMVGVAVLIGLIINLCLFLWHKHGAAFKAWRKERKAAKTASPGAPTPAKEKSLGLGKEAWKALKWILVLAVIGWVWYSLETGTGYWGNKVANQTYEHTEDVLVENLKPQEVCGFRPGEWKFSTPEDDKLYKDYRAEKRLQSGFWIRWGEKGEYHTHLYLQKDLRVNGTARGETVTVNESGCVTVSWLVTDRRKAEAVSLGSPMPDRTLKEGWGPAPLAQAFPFGLRLSK